ncbi:CPBP family intramembrane glutamic endopeptidase [Paenibacillus sp. SI8]|uniref:CPBP family intramembrane glutamic endopeptidase n=1 Tax=unclassified Paenibacillus TaxID=185978 RepID=UPI003466A64D
MDFESLSIVLITLFPLLGYLYYKKIPSIGKLKFYLFLIGWYWMLTAFLYMVNPRHLHFTVEKLEISLIFKLCLWTVILVWLLSEALPVVLALMSKSYRSTIQREVILNNSIPLTLKERALFVLVALTVGFCEEVLWRGLLPVLLHDLSLPLWLSFLAAGISFGLGHFLQGWRGVLNSFIFATAATLIFVLTGSLLMPIILHVLYDLRLVLTGVIIHSKK